MYTHMYVYLYIYIYVWMCVCVHTLELFYALCSTKSECCKTLSLVVKPIKDDCHNSRNL